MSYVNLSTIIEDPVAEFKSELADLNIFEVINEGESIYTGSKPWAQVIPGIDHITLQGNQQLLHEFELYVLFLRGAGSSTLASLRTDAQAGYDKLLLDQTHNSTCWHCLPTHWAPGFFSLGDYNFVGIQTRWKAKNYQTFVPPSTRAPDFPTMDLVTESIIAEIKDELSTIISLDKINEGEEIYDGETVAWVIPGPVQIQSNQRARLNHNMTIYVNIMTSKALTFPAMRNIGQDVYDVMMEDITHDQTCNYCLPTSWHPGFVTYGTKSVVGIQSVWNARIQQSYTPT